MLSMLHTSFVLKFVVFWAVEPKRRYPATMLHDATIQKPLPCKPQIPSVLMLI
jgi:hypothetical protein